MTHRIVILWTLALLTSACAPAAQGPIPTSSAVSPGVLPDFIPTHTLPAPSSTEAVTALAPTATIANVASSTANCTGLRSVVGDDLALITFENWSGRKVDVYWVNYQGLEEFWFELQPDESLKQETYATHPWCARDKSSNAPLLSIVATEDAQIATILGDIEWILETLPPPLASSAPFDSLRGQQLVIHNDRVYLFGGRSDVDERLTDVFFSTIKPDGMFSEWKDTTPLPGKYYDHVTVTLGDYVYLLTGGAGAEDVYFAHFQADGALGNWQQTSPLSPSRQTFAAISNGNFIYVIGGNSGGTQDFVQFASVNADGSLSPWAHTTPLPESIQEHSLIVYDDHLYVIGGRKPNDAWTQTIYFSTIHPDGTLADWKTTTPVPPRAIRGPDVFESNGYLYLLGDGSAYYTRILENHALGKWQPITSLPAVRRGLRIGAHNGYVYAIGGSDDAGHQNTVYYGRLGWTGDQLDCTSGWARLKSGSYAKVSEKNSSPNRVRDAPNTSAKIIQQIYPGGIVLVLEGPVCANGTVFWKVENKSIPGGVGWTAEGDGQEYFLEPIQ